MEYGQIDRGLSRSRALIRGAQAARVLNAEAQIAGELRARLGSLLDLLDECIADRDYWRSLSQADVYSDSFAARELIAIGSAPWEELLRSGGYKSPPPPSADQVAAALSMNVRHAIESDSAELGRRYPSFVLKVRDRLKLHVRILRDRLELSAHPRGARELPFVAKMTTDAALDAATALALPAIAADTVGGAGLGIVASLLSAVRLERQSSWMRKMAAPSGGDFPQWHQIDAFVHNVRHVGDGLHPQLLTHLLDQLEDPFPARAY